MFVLGWLKPLCILISSMFHSRFSNFLEYEVDSFYSHNFTNVATARRFIAQQFSMPCANPRGCPYQHNPARGVICPRCQHVQRQAPLNDANGVLVCPTHQALRKPVTATCFGSCMCVLCLLDAEHDLAIPCPELSMTPFSQGYTQSMQEKVWISDLNLQAQYCLYLTKLHAVSSYMFRLLPNSGCIRLQDVFPHLAPQYIELHTTQALMSLYSDYAVVTNLVHQLRDEQDEPIE